MRDTDFSELLSRPTDRAEFWRQLRGSVVSVERTPDSGSVRFRGTAQFGATLEGPPRKLHGGLHAYARLFPVLAAIPEHDTSTTFPCRVELALGMPIDLHADVPFDGSYSAIGGIYRLDVRHLESDKLAASIESATPGEDPLARFRGPYARVRGTPPTSSFHAERDLATKVYDELIVIDADRTSRDGSASLRTYLTERETMDAAFVCVLLDVVGAVVLGWDVQGRCYTVRMNLTIATDEIPSDVDLVALGDRHVRPDETVPIRPVDLGDRTIGPTEIAVVLADPELRTAYAWGTVTLVPARVRT